MTSLGLGPMVTHIAAFVAGAVIITLETFFLGAIGNMLDKFPALRELGDHIRNSMSQILELALLVGGFTASGAITSLIGYGSIGSMAVMIVWMLNKTAKKPFLMPLAVGPVVTIALAVLVNILSVLGFALV